MSIKPLRASYCATCGHNIDRHSIANLGHGAPCSAPLGHGSTCPCKGFVRIQPKAKNLTPADAFPEEAAEVPKINE